MEKLEHVIELKNEEIKQIENQMSIELG